MKGDLSVIGLQGNFKARVAASATRFEAGEPITLDNVTTTSGAISTNTFTLLANDGPIIGTDVFGGIAIKGALPFKTGTLTAQTVVCARPVAGIGIIRGKAQVPASIDTAAELLAIIGDQTMLDYNGTGGSDGGELYTIIETATADTSGMMIQDGNVAKGELDVVVDARVYRLDVA